MENSDSKMFQIELEQCISSAIPVWEMLNISEEDFKKTYLKPFVIDAKGNETSIDVNNENQEMEKRYLRTEDRLFIQSLVMV